MIIAMFLLVFYARLSSFIIKYIMPYLDNLGQQISNPNFDVDNAPDIDASQMSEEDIDKMIEEQFGWQDHKLNNGPEY